MLDQLTFTGRELLLAIILATAIYVIEALLFSHRRRKARLTAPATPPDDLAARLATLEERMAELESRPPADAGDVVGIGVHTEALRLAREGLGADEVARRLGISQTEAELIIALKRAEA